MSTRKHLGTFFLGWEWVDCFADPTTSGGHFMFCPDTPARRPEMQVGIDYRNWWEVLNVAMHEATEHALARLRCTFTNCQEQVRDTQHIQFHFNHGQFTEAIGMAAAYLDDVLPLLRAEWERAEAARKAEGHYEI